MSEVREKFYELFVPKMEAKGFAFKKSAGKFIKTQGNLQYIIHFKWDGRGGVSIIDGIDYYVTEPANVKSSKRPFDEHDFDRFPIKTISLVDENGKLIIPVMYIQAVLDLANNMNFRALAKFSFEEKYPTVRIQNCVNKVEILLNDHVFLFFEKENYAG